MLSFLKKLKINKNQGPACRQAGMTYIEILVVLSIFAVLSTVIIYNYGEFQAKVDIKNLASDIALKVVEAQKSSLSGNLPPAGAPDPTWKPSYGLYFNIAMPKQFIYFVDLNNANGYENGETLDTILITKNNYISNIDKCTSDPCTSGSSPINPPLSITFSRPSSSAIFTGTSLAGSEYVQISIKSPKTSTAKIKIYPSGRVQVN